MSPLLYAPQPAIWTPQNRRPDYAFETHGRADIASQALSNGRRNLSFFTAYDSKTFTSLMVHSASTLAVAITACRIGLYSVDAAGNLTLVCRCAADTTIGAAINTEYVRALDTTGGYPASYRLKVGALYAGAFYITGSTTPQMDGRTILGTTDPLTINPRVAGFDNSGVGTDLALTITAANVSNISAQLYIGGK